uniref:Autophagy-related protein 16-1 n=2 Tax=Bactrocera latifrons TaxID=174628 RepID=A0A0K8VWY3_BACLA
MRKVFTKRISISVQDENRCLLERLMRYKSKDADKLNEENENFLRKRSDKLKRDLEDAVREPNSQHRNSGSPSQLGADDGDNISLTAGGNNGAIGGIDYYNLDEMLGPLHEPNLNPCLVSSSIPTTIYMKFEAHDNESHAVRWSPVERLVATGGGDRKVKLWDVGKVAQEPRAVLGGSSAGINSVDFDSTGTYILGTSNDYGARVWTVADSRLRVSGKGENNLKHNDKSSNVEKADNAENNKNNENGNVRQSVNQSENQHAVIDGKNARAALDNCALDSLMLNVDSQYFGS